ncbi:MAG: response regulator transcription factor [Crocinitomicaceae bacterium]|nr:response regulator transcription factor [Crocinitomicaceae bacterium]MBK8924704.1 response regulator transcription factor [Crocinitomicaceae bacterium]
MIKFILCESNRLYVDVCKSICKSDQLGFELVFESICKDEIINQISSLKTHLVISDFYWSVSEQITFFKTLKAISPYTKILGWSQIDDKLFLRKLFSAGMNGYVNKNDGIQVLTDAMHGLTQADFYYPYDTKEMIGYKSDQNTILIDELTEREIKITELSYLQYQNKEIADRLNVSVKTVESIKNKLIHKLDAKKFRDVICLLIKHQIIKPDFK